MDTVILKNGAEEAATLVAATMIILHRMMEEAPVTFYEFVCKCRNPQHQMWGDTDRIAAHYGVFGPTGHIHDSIRDITLSAVTGEELQMCLGSPLREQAEAPV